MNVLTIITAIDLIYKSFTQITGIIDKFGDLKDELKLMDKNNEIPEEKWDELKVLENELFSNIEKLKKPKD